MKPHVSPTPEHNTDAATPPAAQLERSITLTGAISLVVGGVVGAGIYALVVPIAIRAGTAIWLSFLLAITVSLAGALPMVQLASAMPRAGAGYLFSSRLLFPLAGTVTSAWILLAGACGTCVVSLAFAMSLFEYIPAGPTPHLVGAALLGLFYLIYLFGLRLAIGLQVVMAAQLVAALLLYGIAGALQLDIQLSYHSPQGLGGLLAAVVLCYNTCIGFQVVAEMGEEIRNARRTIPLALLIGGSLIAAIYILVGIVFVNSVGYDPARDQTTNVSLSASAALLLPSGLVAFVNLGAMTAGLTSFNAAAVALPRELFAQARDGILPLFLGKVDPRTRSPLNAVTAFFLFVILLMLAGFDLEFYGYATAVGMQMMTSVICLACLRLPRNYPHFYRNAYIRLPIWILILCTVITLLASAGFVIIIAQQRPIVVLTYVLLTFLVTAYHLARVRWLIRRGFPWTERVSAIPGTDENDVPPSADQRLHQQQRT